MKERFHFSSFRFDVVVIPSALEYYNQIQEKNLRKTLNYIHHCVNHF